MKRLVMIGFKLDAVLLFRLSGLDTVRFQWRFHKPLCFSTRCQRVPYASGWDTKGQDKVSQPGNLGTGWYFPIVPNHWSNVPQIASKNVNGSGYDPHSALSFKEKMFGQSFLSAAFTNVPSKTIAEIWRHDDIHERKSDGATNWSGQHFIFRLKWKETYPKSR